ncbi:MAG TPA: hypothetical protein DCQ64_15055, partial [Candidatus Rokubacteria bacterium]|nr:hypothetical protein [Candidatus Rokubacteria bacterium]
MERRVPLAVYRLLTRYPEWRGRLRFVQAGVPSRTRIAAYQGLQTRKPSTAREAR